MEQMTITYNIEPDDYLTYQLYMASKSKEIKKKRLRNWILVPFIYILFAGLAFFIGKQRNIALVFSILATLWIGIYPFYSKWMFKDRFRKFIIKNSKEKFGKKVSLTINDNTLSLTDKINSSEVKLSEITSINEIASHYFIKLANGSSIIIPKNQLENDINALNFVQKFLVKHQSKMVKELNWKWK
jgi:hypothetical protein